MMQHDPNGDDGREDRGWRLYATMAIVFVLVFAGTLGFIVVPGTQGRSIGLDLWSSICRAAGIAPGSPARQQPVSDATARPVSQVAWRGEILDTLAAADRSKGAALASQICAACHGDGGLSRDPTYPFLSGQSAIAIYKQLHDYKTGARVHELMTPVVKDLSEEQMADLAAYFGAGAEDFSLGKRFAFVDPATQKLALEGDPSRNLPACNSCHTVGVAGPIEAPTLIGQHAQYLKRQLDLYRSGERSNDVYGRMRTIARTLRADEVERLSVFYQGLR